MSLVPGTYKAVDRSFPQIYSKAWFLRRCPCNRFDGDGGHRGAIIQVDVGHVIVAIVVARPIDVVILHEEHDWDAGVREDLPVGVIEGAARIVVRPDLARKMRMQGGFRQTVRVGAPFAPAPAAARGTPIP